MRRPGARYLSVDAASAAESLRRRTPGQATRVRAERNATEPHPTDPVGAETLECLAGAVRYNAWMFDRIRPWIGSQVLEIGSGIGNLSAFLVDRERLVL